MKVDNATPTPATSSDAVVTFAASDVQDWEPLPYGVDNPRATNNARVDNPWLDWEPVPLAAGKGWQPRKASNADFAPGY